MVMILPVNIADELTITCNNDEYQLYNSRNERVGHLINSTGDLFDTLTIDQVKNVIGNGRNHKAKVLIVDNDNNYALVYFKEV